MKIILLTILTLGTFIQSIGQEIQKITVIGRLVDEPPTKRGTFEHKIEFQVNKKGDLALTRYWIGNKKSKLTKETVIEADRLERVMDWIGSNKKKFSLSEIQLDYETLKANEKTSTYKPQLEFAPDYTISIDSFSICQTYNSLESISTGGYNLNVVMVDKSETYYIYGFDSDDIGMNNLKFFDYVVCYELLHDKLPTNFSGREHFTQTQMVENALFVISTTECEDFYYNEFIGRNPNRTPKENRMKVGWDFVNYLNQRKGN